jgi:hypothetical protein
MHALTKHTAVRRLVLIAAALVVGLITAVAPASAAITVVNPFQCASAGGAVSRPAGSTILIRQGLAEQTRGGLAALLNAQTTTVSLNGGTAVDLTDAWSAPTSPGGDGWLATVEYPTEITLAAGQSLTFVFTLSLAHRVPEVQIPPLGGEPAKPAFNEGTQIWACTVTGV